MDRSITTYKYRQGLLQTVYVWVIGMVLVDEKESQMDSDNKSWQVIISYVISVHSSTFDKVKKVLWSPTIKEKWKMSKRSTEWIVRRLRYVSELGKENQK